ncbi:MAG: hemolysin, partial [Pedobacter sp.]
HHFDYELAHYVKPRNKFKADLTPIDTDLLIEQSDSLKDLDSLIGDIENHHIKIPVLLRQYMNLNAKIICFNIDPKFSDCLDGFLVVDTHKIPADILEKVGKNL